MSVSVCVWLLQDVAGTARGHVVRLYGLILFCAEDAALGGGSSSAGDASVRPGSSDEAPAGCFSLLSRSQFVVLCCASALAEFALRSDAVLSFRLGPKLFGDFETR